MQYSQDYDEHQTPGSDTFGGGEGWARELYSYVKSTGVFVCPSDPSGGGSSYAISSNITVPVAGVSVDSVPNSKFTAPASSVLLFEVTGTAGKFSDGVTAPAATFSVY